MKIDKRIIKKCEEFADSRMQSSSKLYKFRGENNSSKIREDILVGALGEFAVYKYLSSLGYGVSKPDLRLYDSNNKSFDADLMCEEKLIHVKSQGLKSVKRYGNSWLMQKSDPVASCPDDNEYFALTNVDVSTGVVTILGFIRCDKVDYGECRVFSYRKTKSALYFDQLNRRKFWRPKQK